MLIQDLRHGARILWRTPVLTASVILTLALGIGANTAIFSVVDAVLLSPLPYPEPHRLVQVWTRFTGVGLPRDENNVSPPELRDITELGRSFSHIAAYSGTVFNLAAEQFPERVEGARAFQGPSTSASVVIRTERDPGALARQVREQVAAIDAEHPVYDVRTMDGVMSSALAQRR